VTEDRADVKPHLERLAEAIRQAALATSERVLAAFRAVPRHAFLLGGVEVLDGEVPPKALQCDPHCPSAEALDLVYGNWSLLQRRRCSDDITRITANSLPSLTAQALTALEVEEGQRVLEVGSGTGYAAALLGHLVGTAGAVVSVDIVPDFVRAAQRAIAELGLKQVSVVEGDGASGYPAASPYDRILASVSLREVPRGWLEQLQPEGRIVLPLRLTAGGDVLVVFQQEGEGLAGRGLRSCGYQEIEGQQMYDDRGLEVLLEREGESPDFIGAMVKDSEEAWCFRFWLRLQNDPVVSAVEARARLVAGYARWVEQGRPGPCDLRLQVTCSYPAADPGRTALTRPWSDGRWCRVWFERL